MTISPRLPTRLKMFHGLGSVAYGVKDSGFATFLLLFYNQVLGMDARLVSLALMLALVIDGFADPIIGYMSDRTYTKWGRRLPWLYLAPIPLAFAWLLMWAPPDIGPQSMFFYLLAVAILVRALVSCCEVPSVALVPELTRDYDERTALMRFRYLFGWAGGLLMLFLAYNVFLVPDAAHKVGQLNEKGYWAFGVFGAILMALAVMFSAAAQHKRVAHWPATKPEKASVGQALGEITESFHNRAFLIFLAAAAVVLISQGVTFSLSNYLYLYVWHFAQSAFAIYPFVLMASVVCSFFLVGPLTRRFEKPRTAAACAITGMLFWVTPFVLRYLGYWPEIGSDSSTWLVFMLFFLSNVASVIVMITASSMIADVVEDSEMKTGRRTEGLFFAGFFFVQKCSTGLGIFLSGLIIGWAGLSAQTQPDLVDPEVVNRLIEAYIAIVAVAAIFAAALFLRFPISRADHEERVKRLEDSEKTVEALAG